jgi:glycogen debranching enzyme
MTELITNNLGSYFLSGISSRYSGLFFMLNNRMIKILDDNFSDDCKITMPVGKNILIINSKKYMEFMLDVKESYDNSESGRFYELKEEKDKKVIKFAKKTGENMDYILFIVIKGKFQTKKVDKWIKRDYSFDQKRNSTPSERYIYCPFEFKGRLIISASETEENALKELEEIPKTKNKLVGLMQLIAKNNKTTGIFAGLPWFFQFWSRDELISLKALMLSGKTKEAKEIILRNLEAISTDGRLPNKTLPLSNETNADSIGWLFKRIQDYKRFDNKEWEMIVQKLEYSIANITKNYSKDSLIYNNPLETWMDTRWDNDERAGFRIEIQALFLNMLKLAYILTRKKEYLQSEGKMKKIVREKFWNGKFLADGLNDFTKRPNVFIAAYVYPELLTKKEWELCFNNILPALWLEWGGLATIDKSHSLFCRNHTGEIPQSYHRGDSWFWINNLAALCLDRANKEFFKEYIDKILAASKKEFLKMGIPGQQSELSSAYKLESNGCLAQAWSDAMLAELVFELRRS